MNTFATIHDSPYSSYCTHDIDAGNTAIKVFFKDAERRVQCRLFSTEALLKNPKPLLDFLTAQEARVVRWRSSLAEASQLSLRKALSPWGLVPLEKSELLPALASWCYDTSELGLDRMLHIVAARQAVEDPAVVVISAGTATTVDFILDACHLGGWIQSGYALGQDALLEKAPHLKIPIRGDLSLDLGRTTATALAYGGHRPYVLGLAGALREQMAVQFRGNAPTLILRGGYAEALLAVGFEEAVGLSCQSLPDLGAFWSCL